MDFYIFIVITFRFFISIFGMFYAFILRLGYYNNGT